MARRTERTIDLPLPLERVWELVGFTTEVDRLAGKPRGAYAPADEAAPVHLRRLAARRFGVPLLWDEGPWEFERLRFLRCDIVVTGGPVAWMGPRLELAAQGTGTRVRVAVEYEPAPGALGGFGWVMAGALLHGLVRAVKGTGARALAEPAADPWALELPAAGDPGVFGRARAALAAAPARDDVDRGLFDRLARHLASTNDADLARLRPIALARRWGADPARVLPVLLRAAKAGALSLEWALLCPDCQRAAQPPARLAELLATAHCDTCAVSFDTDFAHNVEVVFRPAPSVRALDAFPYCLDNPSRMANCAAMHLLAPGESRRVHVHLEPGAWRLRARRSPGVAPLSVVAGGPSAVVVELGDAATRREPVVVGAGEVEIEVRFVGAERRLVALERTAWLDDVTTAAEVTARQEFRDLFPGEAIVAGERIAVQSLAFLFTDLEGSTALYERLGDGPAYDLVSDHFRILGPCIAEAGGALVKTIGDAVMAVFPSGVAAAKAGLAMLAAIDARNGAEPGRPQVGLRVGVHEGPCFAVGANDVLDYFGTTVNVAARLQGLAAGGDLVLDAALAGRPELAEALAPHAVTRSVARLKGLSGDFAFARVTWEAADRR